jgi:hypothetical protein
MEYVLAFIDFFLIYLPVNLVYNPTLVVSRFGYTQSNES